MNPKSPPKSLKSKETEIDHLNTPINIHELDRPAIKNSRRMGLKSVTGSTAPRRSARLVSMRRTGEFEGKSSPVPSPSGSFDRGSKRRKSVNKRNVDVEIVRVDKFDDDDSEVIRVLDVRECTPDDKSLAPVLIRSERSDSENVEKLDVEKVRVSELKNAEDVMDDVEMARFNGEETTETLQRVKGKRKLNSGSRCRCSYRDDDEYVAEQIASALMRAKVGKICISDSEDNECQRCCRKEELGVDNNDSETMASNEDDEDYNYRPRLWVKGKAKVVDGDGVDSDEMEFENSHNYRPRLWVKGKAKVVDDDGVDSDEMEFEDSLIRDSVNDENDTGDARIRFSRVEKGKGIMNEGELLSTEADLVYNAAPQPVQLLEEVAIEVERVVIDRGMRNAEYWRDQSSIRAKERAKERAYEFAHFVAEEKVQTNPSDEDEEAIPSQEVDAKVEDWPGPFSTAMKIMKDRASKLEQQQETSFSNLIKPIDVSWTPKSNEAPQVINRMPPMLQEMCLKVLVTHAEAIQSLDNVPCLLRHQLSKLLCDSRRMNSQVFSILISGSPTEVRVKDCSHITEEQFTRCFEGFDKSNLTVLQLDQCGRCLPDYVVQTAIGLSLNSLPSLTTLSLKGGCRLSDIGLSSLVMSAPALRSINLSQCSLLTAAAIDTLANTLGSILRELYIDDCQGINLKLALPALKKLQQLQVLSLSGIESVSNAFIRNFMSECGHNMRELVLGDCVKLTDSAIKVIAQSCPKLCVLDLTNLTKLTDSSLLFLANSPLEIQKLRLRRNPFSDEGIAAYLNTSGKFLLELSLNNVKKVGHNTALAIAEHSRKLEDLDLSFCRNVTENAMGFIVDSCLSMKLLKIFGCTQVTDRFLNGTFKSRCKDNWHEVDSNTKAPHSTSFRSSSFALFIICWLIAELARKPFFVLTTILHSFICLPVIHHMISGNLQL